MSTKHCVSALWKIKERLREGKQSRAINQPLWFHTEGDTCNHNDLKKEFDPTVGQE